MDDTPPTGDRDVTPAPAEVRADARVARAREAAAALERAEPLARRVLMSLSERPTTPSVLAQRLEAQTETMSRVLRGLRERGLVEARPVLGDGRLREYDLTGNGRIELGRLRAFGTPEPAPPAPTQSELEDLLRAAIRHAVGLRRGKNQLGPAAERLRMVIREAQRAGAREVLVDATAELATTLRQQSQVHDVRALLEQLDSIALDPDATASVTLPASAHRLYGLGRLDEHRAENLLERAQYLGDAARQYARLAEAPGWDRRTDWRERQAWSLMGLAINLRVQSRFEAALTYSAAAAQPCGVLASIPGAGSTELLLRRVVRRSQHSG